MPTIREVAQLIGMMVSSLPGFDYGELYFRQIEIEKAAALKSTHGDFDSPMQFIGRAKSDIL